MNIRYSKKSLMQHERNKITPHCWRKMPLVSSNVISERPLTIVIGCAMYFPVNCDGGIFSLHIVPDLFLRI